MPAPALFSALRHANYRLFFYGQLISLTGSWMQNTAQGWLIVLLAHAGADDANYYLGMATTMGSLPMLLGSFWGGVVADRYAKRTIIIGTQVAQGLLALGMAALIAAGYVQVGHVLAFALLLGLTNILDIPTRQAFVVEMVGRADLPNAIGLNSSLFNASRIVGPALAGLAIGAIGGQGERSALAACFLINGLSYLAVIAGLLRMRGDFRPAQSHHDRPGPALREALDYIRTRPALRTLMLLIAAFSVFMAADWVLLPSLAKYTLGADAKRFGWLMSLKGIGALAGALTVAALAGYDRKGLIVTLASLATPALALGVATCRHYTVVGGLIAAEGYCMVVLFALANSLLQTSVSDTLRGRVMGFHAWTMMGLTPIGSVWAGLVAHHSNAPTTIQIGASAALLWGIVTALRAPALRLSGAHLLETSTVPPGAQPRSLPR